MKRQFKAAALVSTAALLAIGASFTSMAAAKAKTGTWVLEADGWYCYDKNGEAYTDEWCLSYGKEYFVDGDGLLATHSWIEDEDKYYFVGSTGAKTVNDWRYTTAFADEDGEEGWFWFDAKGEMATGKKVIGGKTYYFAEDGKMLTGWVHYNSDTKVAELGDNYADDDTVGEYLVYCDESGARMENQWLETWAPEVDEEEEEDYDKNWHYVNANGNLQTAKKNDIKGKTYLFNDDGVMLYGWVRSVDEDEDGKYTNYVSLNKGDISEALATDPGSSVFFCGSYDSGSVRKDKWINTWTPADFLGEDDDIDKYWYYAEKDGKIFAPNYGTEFTKVKFMDGGNNYLDPVYKPNGTGVGIMKEVGKKTYLFNTDGVMQSGLIDFTASNASSSDAERYYFGGSGDGAMKTGNVMISDDGGLEYKFYFAEKDNDKGYHKGVAVHGSANKYLYNNGQLMTQDWFKYAEVPFTFEDGEEAFFIINNNGAIQTTKKTYKDGSKTLFTFDQETNNGGEKSYKKGSYEESVFGE